MMQSQRLSADISRFITNHILWILILVVLLVIAYGYTAFSYTNVGDEWHLVQIEEAQYDWVVKLGRWLQRVTWEFGGHNYPAPVLTTTFFSLCLIVGAWLQYKTVNPGSTVAFFVAASVFALAPFWAEAVTYNPQHLVTGIGAILGSAFGYVMKHTSLSVWSQPGNHLQTLVYFLLSIFFFVMAAGAVQIHIFYGVMAYLAWIAYDVITSESMTIKAITQHLISLAIVAILSLVAYLLLTQIIMTAIDIRPLPADHRYSMTGSLVTSLEDLSFTLNRLSEYMGQYLFQPSLLFPVISKYTFLVILAICIVLAAFLLRRSGYSRRMKILRFIVFLFILVLLFLTPWSIGIIRTEGSYRYNALIGVAAIYSSIFLLGIGWAQLAQWRRGIWGIIGAGLLIAFIFAFQHNMAAVIAQINNDRDASIATRILYQLESQPNYGDLVASGEEVYFTIIGRPNQQDGRPFDPPDVPRPMDSALFSCGVFDCQPRRILALLNLYQYGAVDYVQGQSNPAQWRTQADIPEELSTAVASMAVFPLDGSVLITDDLSRVIIKLSEVVPGEG